MPRTYTTRQTPPCDHTRHAGGHLEQGNNTPRSFRSLAHCTLHIHTLHGVVGVVVGVQRPGLGYGARKLVGIDVVDAD